MFARTKFLKPFTQIEEKFIFAKVIYFLALLL
jgi:hypothetical protein